MPVARRTDPGTSWAAADSVNDVGKLQARILAALAHGPMTDEQLAEALRDFHPSPSGLRTRRSELVDAGQVRASGQTERLASGRRAILWELAPKQPIAPRCPQCNQVMGYIEPTVDARFVMAKCITHGRQAVRVG